LLAVTDAASWVSPMADADAVRLTESTLLLSNAALSAADCAPSDASAPLSDVSAPLI